jgi:hypothetical protein
MILQLKFSYLREMLDCEFLADTDGVGQLLCNYLGQRFKRVEHIENCKNLETFHIVMKAPMNVSSRRYLSHTEAIQRKCVVVFATRNFEYQRPTALKLSMQ